MFRVFSAMAIVAGLGLTGCGRPIPRTAAGPVGVPHVGWVIMIGDRDNPDRDFVCYSEAPGECSVPPSRASDQVFADVHLYYHPAATETKYDGAVQIGFFSSPLDLKPNVTVKPAASPGNQGIVGIVSDKPGTYPFTIAVDATPAQGGPARQIRQQIQVVVR